MSLRPEANVKSASTRPAVWFYAKCENVRNGAKWIVIHSGKHWENRNTTKHIFNPLNFYIVTSGRLNYPLETYARPIFTISPEIGNENSKVTYYETPPNGDFYMEDARSLKSTDCSGSCKKVVNSI